MLSARKLCLVMLTMVIQNSTSQAQNVGIGTANPKARLQVIDSSVVFSASGSAFAHGFIPVTGAGRSMMWYADIRIMNSGETCTYSNAQVNVLALPMYSIVVWKQISVEIYQIK